jgi:hypothetical protein
MALAQASAKVVLPGNASQAAMALAQASAKDLLQVAASQDGMVAIAGQSWLSLRAQSAAAAAISISADASAKKALELDPNALAAPADVPMPAPAAPELGLNLMNVAAWLPAGTPTPLSTLRDSQHAGLATTKLLADQALLSAHPKPGTEVLDAATSLAAAVQAGLGMVPLQQATGLDESAVTVTSLTIEKSGGNHAAALVDTGAAALAAAKALIQMRATAGTSPIEETGSRRGRCGPDSPVP